MVYVTSLQRDVIFAAVRAMYTDVAMHPERVYHFPIGRAACAHVGYPPERLRDLPPATVESFAGVGYPFACRVIRTGDTVLDVGSGSGTDLLLAAAEAGAAGQAIGLDLTAAMLAKLERIAGDAGLAHLRLLEGNAERIPLPDGSVDVVTSNGVINLVPDKRAAFAEMFRVLRPGGRVQIADIALGRPMSAECASDPQLWAECIVGATREDEYVGMLEDAGLTHVEILGCLDYFSASTSSATRSIAGLFRAGSIVVRAAKPPSPPLPPPRPWPPAAVTRGDTGPGVPGGDPLPSPDAVLDGRGQACGVLEPSMKRSMRALESGRILEVLADDPGSRLGIPAWSRLTGHAMVAVVEREDGCARFFLRKR